MDHLRWFVNALLCIVLGLQLVFLYFYVSMNYPDQAQLFGVKERMVVPSFVANVSSQAKLFYPNMRFNHNEISFFISFDCSDLEKLKLLNAFLILTNETEVLTFYPTDEVSADILVSCSPSSFKQEKSIFVSGEGGPTRIVNTTLYPIITKGKIMLYNETTCSKPITELHELLHVFGFEHINDSRKIMYPYLGCNQTPDKDMIELLKELYSIEPLPELSLSNVESVKVGYYLNFTVQISNEGLVDAEDVILEVDADGSKVKSFYLGLIAFGTAKTFYVSNLGLPSKNVKIITLEAKSNQKEYSYENNVIELEILKS